MEDVLASTQPHYLFLFLAGLNLFFILLLISPRRPHLTPFLFGKVVINLVNLEAFHAYDALSLIELVFLHKFLAIYDQLGGLSQNILTLLLDLSLLRRISLLERNDTLNLSQVNELLQLLKQLNVLKLNDHLVGVFLGSQYALVVYRKRIFHIFMSLKMLIIIRFALTVLNIVKLLWNLFSIIIKLSIVITMHLLDTNCLHTVLLLSKKKGLY